MQRNLLGKHLNKVNKYLTVVHNWCYVGGTPAMVDDLPVSKCGSTGISSVPGNQRLTQRDL